MLGIRPHQVTIERDGPGALELPAEIRLAEVTGSATFLHLLLEGGRHLVAHLPGTQLFTPGERAVAYVDPAHVFVFDEAGGSGAGCSPPAPRRWTCMADIRLEGVGHSYDGGRTWAVKPTTWTWRGSRAYALLGPSGCGKTTLLNIISGLITPTEGRVFFDDRDVTGVPTAGRNIAQVFQFPVLYEEMSVYDNLAFPSGTGRCPSRRWTGGSARSPGCSASTRCWAAGPAGWTRAASRSSAWAAAWSAPRSPPSCSTSR
ncbi:ATP-binding cassette domain-containing protein [Nonomuraea thailandensis]